TWIEVTVDGPTRPRQRFSAVPFARKVPVDGTTLTYDATGRLTVGSLPLATSASSAINKATPGFLSVDANGDITGIAATTAQDFTGTLTGDVTGTQSGTFLSYLQGNPVAA